MKFKRLFGLLLAMIMVFGLAVPAMAEETEPETEKVILHKMMFNPKDAENNASITDKWTQADIDAMKLQSDYETDQDYAAEVDRLQDLMNAIPENETKEVAKWAGYIGFDADGNYELYQGQELSKDKFFGQGVTEVPGVYFQWFSKEGKPQAITYTDDETYTIGDADAATIASGKDLDDIPVSEKAGSYLLAGMTKDNGIEFPTKGMEGDYVIREIFEKSTYSQDDDKEITAAEAVPVELTMPMVGPQGVLTEAHVYPKNTDDTPQIDKDFEEGFDETNNDDITIENKNELDPENPITGPDYQNYKGTKAEINTLIGKEVPYAVKTLVPANARYKNFVWEDTMTHGLTYLKNLKNGLKDSESTAAITGTNGKLQMFKKDKSDVVDELIINTDYTVKETESGFVIELTDGGLKKINGRSEAVEFRMHYSAQVNGSTIVDIPETNDIRLDFGRQPKQKHQEFTPDRTEITLKKDWAEGLPEEDKVEATFKLEKYDERTDSWTVVQEAIKLNSGNGWETTINELTAGAKYRFTEVDIEGYTEEYVGYDSETGTYTVKNYKETVEPKDGKLIIDKKFTGTTPKEGEELVFDLWQIKDGSEKNLYTIEVKVSGEEFTVERINGKAPAEGENNKLPYTFEGLEEGTYKLTERLSGYTAFPVITADKITKVPTIQLENKKTNDNPEPKDPKEPTVRVGGKKFVKTDETDNGTRLAGAEFIVLRKKPGAADALQYLVLKDSEVAANEYSAYTTARDKYLKAYADRNKLAELATAETIDAEAVQAIYNDYTAELKDLGKETPTNNTKEGIEEVVALFDQLEDKAKDPAVKAGILQQFERARDEAFEKSNMKYEWRDATKKDSKDLADFNDAYVLKSDEEGRFEIVGLTYNKGDEKYILREVKAPEGYALKTSDDNFEVKEGSYEGVAGDIQYNKDNADDGRGQQVKNKKLTIPPTGGIGTVIFTVAGLALMAIAIVAISKKRSDDLLEEN